MLLNIIARKFETPHGQATANPLMAGAIKHANASASARANPAANDADVSGPALQRRRRSLRHERLTLGRAEMRTSWF